MFPPGALLCFSPCIWSQTSLTSVFWDQMQQSLKVGKKLFPRLFPDARPRPQHQATPLTPTAWTDYEVENPVLPPRQFFLHVTVWWRFHRCPAPSSESPALAPLSPAPSPPLLNFELWTCTVRRPGSIWDACISAIMTNSWHKDWHGFYFLVILFAKTLWPLNNIFQFHKIDFYNYLAVWEREKSKVINNVWRKFALIQPYWY